MAFYRPEAYLLPNNSQSTVSLEGQGKMIPNNSHLGYIANSHLQATPTNKTVREM